MLYVMTVSRCAPDMEAGCKGNHTALKGDTSPKQSNLKWGRKIKVIQMGWGR